MNQNLRANSKESGEMIDLGPENQAHHFSARQHTNYSPIPRPLADIACYPAVGFLASCQSPDFCTSIHKHRETELVKWTAK